VFIISLFSNYIKIQNGKKCRVFVQKAIESRPQPDHSRGIRRGFPGVSGTPL